MGAYTLVMSPWLKVEFSGLTVFPLKRDIMMPSISVGQAVSSLSGLSPSDVPTRHTGRPSLRTKILTEDICDTASLIFERRLFKKRQSLSGGSAVLLLSMEEIRAGDIIVPVDSARMWA